eukprot:347380-Prymnesium_polylepis.1
MQATAEVLHRKRNVGSRRPCGVHEAADGLHELGVRVGRPRQRVGHRLEERGRVGQLRAGCQRYAIGAEALDQLADVGRLVQLDRAVGEVVDLDAEQVLITA